MLADEPDETGRIGPFERVDDGPRLEDEEGWHCRDGAEGCGGGGQEEKGWRGREREAPREGGEGRPRRI